MSYCECGKGYDTLKPRLFLHVRTTYSFEGASGRFADYLHNINRLIPGARKCWVLSSDKSSAHIFHALHEAKRAAKVAVVRDKFKSSYWHDVVVDIVCRHCGGVVWPKNVLVQLAEVSE